MTIDEKFHRFNRAVASDELPPHFTYPFCYTPHPLCMEAAEQLKQHLSSQDNLLAELNEGKMLGVLVVEDPHGEIGFLAAFSGNLAHSNNLPYFVPAVYDLLDPDGEFCQGERAISAINHRIAAMQRDEHFAAVKQQYDAHRQNIEIELEAFRAEVKGEKAQRDALRASGELSPQQEAEMIARSQYLKAELKRRKKAAADTIAQLPEAGELASFTQEIDNLKHQRHSMSSHLQQRLFRLFVMKNALGESNDLAQIFKPTTTGIPPAGAGECAAPKLLQYAFNHNLTPRAMAEFWWGKSPAAEVRHHGNFYPACRSKCLPILTYMMQGMDVDPNPHDSDNQQKISIIYDDKWFSIVDKPSGLITVPGNISSDSMLERYQLLYPDAVGPMIVHRLDMHTSGLVIVAKDKDTHKALQSLIASRQVEKHYEALLDGEVTTDSGIIDLPICPNPNDRPRQMVDYDNGKSAITEYRVVSRDNGITRIDFRPITGRTHQLRMHAAHSQGLNAPIVGDALYGKQTAHHSAQRLCLHAKSLKFKHPITSEIICVNSQVPF